MKRRVGDDHHNSSLKKIKHSEEEHNNNLTNLPGNALGNIIKFLGYATADDLKLTCKALLIKCFIDDFIVNGIGNVVNRVRRRNFSYIFKESHIISRYYQFLANSNKLKEEKIEEWKKWYSKKAKKKGNVFLACPKEFQEELKTKLLNLASYSIKLRTAVYDHSKTVGVCHLLPDLHLFHYDHSVYIVESEIEIRKLTIGAIRDYYYLDAERDGDEEENPENHSWSYRICNYGKVLFSFGEEELSDDDDNTTESELNVNLKSLKFIRRKLNIGKSIKDDLLTNALVFLLPWKFELVNNVETDTKFANEEKTRHDAKYLPNPIHFSVINYDDHDDQSQEEEDEEKEDTEISKDSDDLKSIFLLSDEWSIILNYLPISTIMNVSLTCKKLLSVVNFMGWRFSSCLERKLKLYLDIAPKELQCNFKEIKYPIKQARFKYWVNNKQLNHVNYLKIKHVVIDYQEVAKVAMKVGKLDFYHFAYDDHGSRPWFFILVNTLKIPQTTQKRDLNCPNGYGPLFVEKSIVDCIRNEVYDWRDLPDEKVIDSLIDCLPWSRENSNLVFYSKIKVV